MVLSEQEKSLCSGSLHSESGSLTYKKNNENAGTLQVGWEGRKQ